MHPVAGQVEIPLEQLERILLRKAVKGFHGFVEITVRVLKEAANSVELVPEVHEFQKTRAMSLSWSELGRKEQFERPKPEPDRAGIVRARITESDGKMCLAATVRRIRANYDDGELRTIEWVLPQAAEKVGE